jgi:hypothetical protein
MKPPCLVAFLIGLTNVVMMADDGPAPAKPHAKPNILFIAVDDLRPELNCHGKTQLKSPNIEKPAADLPEYKETLQSMRNLLKERMAEADISRVPSTRRKTNQ